METRAEIAESAASADPDVGLRAVAALRALTEELEALQVDRARGSGWSWQDIAARLGVSKQTVHRKHGRRVAHAVRGDSRNRPVTT
ncbi:helix-turn-helix domain-containing protein [Actinophytocola sp.]|uniref:helix-turn-helix domain-containing protein n=1 Tax=Actinophytocola sp. TaxID=1872138 RepID=UPI00389A1190